jgi:hypothetical protein
MERLCRSAEAGKLGLCAANILTVGTVVAAYTVREMQRKNRRACEPTAGERFWNRYETDDSVVQARERQSGQN